MQNEREVVAGMLNINNLTGETKMKTLRDINLPPNHKDMTLHEKILCLLEILINKNNVGSDRDPSSLTRLALRELDKLREEFDHEDWANDWQDSMEEIG